jgi:uncharacterized protein YnzC (UPF0291/DUF896 family)
MLHRQDSEGLTIISQPAHAWISGQIARNWGADPFLVPSEEVCLAAELHDIGFLHWEEFPTLDTATGLPHDFLHMPPEIHLELWRKGVQNMLRFGRYPALLVSMHFSNISRQNWVSDKKKENGLLQAYMEEQDVFQKTLLTSLRNDFHYGASLSEEIAVRDQQMVSIFDWLSLLACLRLREQKTIPDVPTRGQKLPITLTPLDSNGRRLQLDPWPLRVPRLELVCEGRRVLKTYKDQEEMRESLKAASRVTVITELVRAD